MQLFPSNADFSAAKRGMKILEGDAVYDRLKGEFNPSIVTHFLNNYSKPGKVLYDPFAGTQAKFTAMACKVSDVEFVGHDLNPSCEEVELKDSIAEAPRLEPNYMIFHPPYFGGGAFSEDVRDVARIGTSDNYVNALKNCVKRSGHNLETVCVVGRSYLSSGTRVELDWLFVNMFQVFGYSTVEILNSVPDIIIIMKKDFK